MISKRFPWNAKKYLQMALNELVEVGFLKGYRFEGYVVVLERYPMEVLRIKAIELQRKLEKEIQEFIDKFSKAVRESKRKRKERNKRDNPKQ
jgi:hypothetical protein